MYASEFERYEIRTEVRFNGQDQRYPYHASHRLIYILATWSLTHFSGSPWPCLIIQCSLSITISWIKLLRERWRKPNSIFSDPNKIIRKRRRWRKWLVTRSFSMTNVLNSILCISIFVTFNDNLHLEEISGEMNLTSPQRLQAYYNVNYNNMTSIKHS